MRKKNWAALLCSILILASLGLGVSIIYSDYYFSPVSGLQSFTVADVSRTYLHPEEDTGTPSAAAPSDELYVLLERWALENEATILYKNGFAAGCGILDGSDWLREAVGLSLPCDAQGVLTAEDAAFSETYVRDGRFLPDALGLPVLGTYREQDVPSVISNAGFLYLFVLGYHVIPLAGTLLILSLNRLASPLNLLMVFAATMGSAFLVTSIVQQRFVSKFSQGLRRE